MSPLEWENVQHFTRAELACNCCDVEKMNTKFVERLDAMRARLGFPFVVTSGYRCAAHNQRVSTTGANGPHTTGRAVDIKVMGSRAFEIIRWAPTFSMIGIGVSQSGDHGRRFIHLDNLESDNKRQRPWVWSY